ncbi:MAG: hypothetical protein K5880_10620 [Hydrogenophaga sp.]|uniref:hypothetical protein n=1 Tax=Hydrogenophaga sp. TaxID=1904254 RepID=UPI00261F5E89|nr:hypothetical protein [Hydrogenophaga sp.]MCV0439077.1 hypothetical protein [Hydrogenophaga sp.]
MLALCEEPDVRNTRGLPLDIQPSPAPLRPLEVHQPFVDVQAVLRLVAQGLQDVIEQDRSASPAGLDARLLGVFEACHALNTARLQMLDVLETQTGLDRLCHILRARVGGEPTPEMRKLERAAAEMRRTVMMAGDAWHRAGRVFTRLTRLLPVQLEESAPRFEAVDAVEMARLARASEWRYLGRDAALKQLARARARRRNAMEPWEAPTPEDLCEWTARMQDACRKAASPFADARERYERAVADHAGVRERATQADRARLDAENGFRIGVRPAHELAAALIEHSQLRRETTQKAARACVARYALYAEAGLLSEQFGLE